MNYSAWNRTTKNERSLFHHSYYKEQPILENIYLVFAIKICFISIIKGFVLNICLCLFSLVNK